MENKEVNNAFCCPKCGGRNLQITTETTERTTGKNFSAGKGCLGYLMFGPMGILCGSCGQQQKTNVTNTQFWVCPDCGNKFRNPDDIRQELNKYKTTFGMPLLIVSILLAVFMIIIGVVIDLSVFCVFGSVCVAIYILGYVCAHKILIPQKQKELSEILDGMNRFRR